MIVCMVCIGVRYFGVVMVVVAVVVIHSMFVRLIMLCHFSWFSLLFYVLLDYVDSCVWLL